MSSYKLILIMVLLIAVNNFMLFMYDGFPSGRIEQPAINSTSEDGSELESRKETFAETSRLEVNTHTSVSKQDGSAVQVTDAELIDALMRISGTARFAEIFDEYRANAAVRHRESAKRISTMNIVELFDVAMNAERSSDKRLAFQSLMQGGKINKLEPHELKSLFQSDEADRYHKSQILVNLLETGDVEALEWAKQDLSQKNLGNFMDSEIVVMIHEQDPQFIVQYLDEIKIEDLDGRRGLYGLLHREPELGAKFYSKHLDGILDADDKRVFQIAPGSVKFDMSQEQQSRVANLFSSKYKHHRHFAFGMIQNIDNIDHLRESYTKLTKKQDKQTFLHGLYGDRSRDDHLSLFGELAVDSTDPQMQRLARELELMSGRKN